MIRTIALASIVACLLPAAPARAQDAGAAGDDSDTEQPTIDPDTDPDVNPDGDGDGDGDADAPAPDDDGSDPTADPGLVTAQPPPDRWQTYSVEGELLEPAATVEALLAQRMDKAQVLNETSQRELAEFCRDQLGYTLLAIKKQRESGGALHATLVLRPRLAVYRVEVNVDNLPEDWWVPWVFVPNAGTITRGFFESVFSDQVRRRMRLRQGSHLDRDPDSQARVLIRERARIEEFLKNGGFFDSRVRVDVVPRDQHSVSIKVNITKGRRYQVGAVQVVGAEAIDPYEIESKFKHPWVCFLLCIFEGGFSREQLTKDVQAVVKMYHDRGYPGARVRTDFDVRHSFNRDTKTVEFTAFVTERRRVDVIFNGNDKKKSPDDQLKKQLTFTEEGSYDDLEIRSSAEAIRRYYQAKGHFEASVATERVSFGVFERINFTIDEGPRLPVKEVSFVGNQSVDTGTLRRLVKTRQFERVALLGGGGGFVTTLQLEQDVARILDLYRRRGYPQVKARARVARDRVVQDNAAALAAAVAGQLDADGLYVRFIIEEGPQQRVSAVEVLFPNEFQTLAAIRDPAEKDAKRRYFDQQRRNILGQLRLRADDPFHPSRLRADLARLTRYQFERGHPHAGIEPRVCPRLDPAARHDCPGDSDPRKVSVTWVVDEKAPISFGEMVVRGNFHTADWVVFDELGISPGDAMTLARAERAQQNLRTTGLFKAVNVNYVDFEDDALDSHNVVINLQERERIELELAGGYSSDSGRFVEVAGRHRNWLGIGLKPDARVLWGDELQQFETKLTLPRWIGRRMSGGLIAFNTETAAFVRNETTERFGDLLSFGTSLSLSKAGQYGFFRGWVAALRYDLRARFRDVDLVRPAGASEDLTSGKVPTVTGSVGPQIVIDRRTDRDGRPQPLLPEKGWQIEARLSYADPVLSQPVRIVGSNPGRDRFIKVGGSGQVFWKPSRRTLISNAVRYDHGIPLGGAFLLPEVERFFAGGDTTVRGFEEDRLATEIIEEPLPPLGSVTQLRVLPAGGNIRMIHNIDLQLEVWSLAGFPVTSAVFFDTGLVTNSLDGFEVTNLRHAVGAALFRWSLPVGSLSLEYAVPLDPRTGDNPRGRFHFNLGLLF